MRGVAPVRVDAGATAVGLALATVRRRAGASVGVDAGNGNHPLPFVPVGQFGVLALSRWRSLPERHI